MIPGIVAQAATGAGGGEQPLEGTVELLLGFNGTNGATTFYDEGRRARPLSWLGNVVHSNAQSKFGGMSARFDGSNDAIFIPPGPGLIFGAEPFAIEAFVRFASLSPAVQFVATHRAGDGTNNVAWSIAKNNANKFELFVGADGRADVVTILSLAAVVINRWYHVAVTRDENGVLRFFVDGVLQGKVANVIQITELRKPVIIGASGYTLNSTGITGDALNGWLDEVRIVKGDAVYDSDAAFTPPISQFPRPVQETTPPADPYFANVIALFGFDGNEGSFVFRDDSTKQRQQLYKWGYGVNTKVNGAIGGRRGAAYDIPPSSGISVIELADTADLAFGTQPFTVEAWVRQDAWRANAMLIGQRINGGTQSGQAWNMTLLDNGRLEWQMIDTSGTVFSVATPVPTLAIGRTTNAWFHLAVSRDADGVVRLYVNGVLELQQSPTTLPFSVRDVNTNLTLFGAYDRNGLTFIGTADEIRVTRGIARYVEARFDIPETQFSRGENAPPNFAVAPSITSASGFFAVGDVLRLNYGTHNGRDPLPQWRRDGEPIPGATGRSYTLAAADAGAQIDAGVAVWNYQGDTTAYAAPVGPVAASAAFETGALAPAGDMQSGGDRLIPNGDAQSGGDVLLWKERIQ